jgi:hypothetical protein
MNKGGRPRKPPRKVVKLPETTHKLLKYTAHENKTDMLVLADTAIKQYIRKYK